MTAPLRTPVVEWFVGSAWRDISSDVRQAPGVTIVPGRKDEAAQTPPGKCTFVLDDGPEHGDGDHNPENAAGPWFGELGRNTPVRVSLPYGTDAFDRVVASGWGTGDLGTYSSFTNAAPASDVTAAGGRHLISATTAYLAHYLPAVSIKDVDLYVTARMATAFTITGGSLEIANLMVRGQATSGSNYYMLRVEITTAHRINARIMLGDGTTLVGPVDCGPYAVTSAPMGVRFQADGHALRGKVWLVSAGEPYGWNVETSRVGPLGAGWVGVRSGVSSTNTNASPRTFVYGPLVVRLPRFAGHTAKMTPTHTLDHALASVAVEAAGYLRIVRKGTATLGTPLRRYLDTSGSPGTVVDFWPLDESAEAANKGVNAVAGGARAKFARDTSNPLIPKGAIKWGATDGLPSLGPALTLTEGAYLTLPVQAGQFGTQWSAAWMQKISADSGGSCWLRTQGSPGAGDISFVWYTDGSYEVYLISSPDVLLFSGVFTQYGFDDVWHSIKFSYVRQSATDVLVLLGVDDDQQLGVIVSPVTYVPLLRFEAQAEPTSTAPASYAQVIIFTERIDALVPDPLGTDTTLMFALDQAYRGWPGEPAAARFGRLNGEQGISYVIAGDPAASQLMGPQRDTSLNDQIAECVAVDQGSLFEPKGHAGLGLVTLGALLDRGDRTPALTLDYAAQEVTETFGPVRDDQPTVNDVTAKDLAGEQVRLEQTTGPLNVNDPGTDPNGVGRIPKAYTTNVQSPSQLWDQAGWRLHLGTVDEPRFPTIAVDLGAPAFAAMSRAVDVLDVGVDDILEVINAQQARIYDPVRQVARGWTEKLSERFPPTIAFNTTPASPYHAATLDAAAAILDSDTSRLAAPFNAGVDTTMSVTTTDVRWTVTAGDFPFNVRLAGVVVQVTAIAGSGSTHGITQTFTVTAAPVNGVTKLVPVDTPVALADPDYFAP